MSREYEYARYPNEDVEDQESMVPLNLRPDDLELNIYNTEDGGKVSKSKTNWWTLFWVALFFVAIIFFAMWLFSMYKKWKLLKFAQEQRQNVNGLLGNVFSAISTQPSPQQQLTGFPNNGNNNNAFLWSPPSSPKGTIVPQFTTVPNPQHTLMIPSTPNSPISDISPGRVFNNDPRDARVHFYFSDYNNRDDSKLYRQFLKLKKRCEQKDFCQKFGAVRFSKCHIGTPEGKQFWNQLQVDGMNRSKRHPMVTFAPAGVYNEQALGLKDAKAKQLMQNLVDNLHLAQTNTRKNTRAMSKQFAQQQQQLLQQQGNSIPNSPNSSI